MDKLELLEQHFTIRETVHGSFLYRGNDCVLYFLHRNKVYIECPGDRQVRSIHIHLDDERFMVEVNKAFEVLSV